MSTPLPAAAIDPLDLRRAASRFASGVALVTSPGGLALVVDSFVSVSLDPPLVAVSPCWSAPWNASTPPAITRSQSAACKRRVRAGTTRRSSSSAETSQRCGL
jgi:flavin reductase (DIM6/NTAB) family NADH-FMN oxidoreductase RutF